MILPAVLRWQAAHVAPGGTIYRGQRRGKLRFQFGDAIALRSERRLVLVAHFRKCLDDAAYVATVVNSLTHDSYVTPNRFVHDCLSWVSQPAAITPGGA